MSIFKRFRRKAGTDTPAPSIAPVDPATLGFGVGDIVRDMWGHEHMVTEIDPTAEHGLGIIRTQRLSDGVLLGTAMMAHSFTFVRLAGNDDISASN
jgi:hypothetical protein